MNCKRKQHKHKVGQAKKTATTTTLYYPHVQEALTLPPVSSELDTLGFDYLLAVYKATVFERYGALL